MDWDGDGLWTTPLEKIIGTFSPSGQIPVDPETFGPNNRYTIGEPFTDVNGSGTWEPDEPYTEQFGQTAQKQVFIVWAPPIMSLEFYSRFRIDYGEDAGIVGNASANLIQEMGQAAFGEVEDYPHAGLEPDYPPVYADQLHLAGPADWQINIGNIADLDVAVERMFLGVPDAGLLFTRLMGDCTFLDGAVDAGGGEAAMLTEDDGHAHMRILANGGGLVLIEIRAPGAPNLSPVYAFFNIAGPCMPDCAGKQCGDDGCGGTCGDCQEGFLCTPAGLCQPALMGDFDDDDDVDLGDFAAFQTCLDAAGGTRAARCSVLDYDQDSVIDLSDMVEFEAHLSGPE